MQKVILPILLIALLVNSCKKGGLPPSVDGCPIDSTIRNGYLNDAKEIVYGRILNGEVVQDRNKPEFNQQELDRVLSAFESVNAMHSAQSDSIFNTLQIHAFKHYVLNSIILKVDLNSPEIQNFINGQPTGNAAFDGLLAQYGFKYHDSSPPSPNLPYLAIMSSNWYNIQALLPAFKQFSFILGEDGDGTVGDGNDITYRLTGTDRIIDFSIGSGDCPAGCIHRKIWEFKVDVNCKASFVKVYYQ